MKFKAEMGHWSSIVGNSVHLIGEDGRFLGQIAILCQDDRLREKDVQTEICEKICTALNADLRGTGPAERYWEGRWRDEAAEIERLTKERDEARAQVAAAYEAAASIVVTGEPEISPITRHAITALTPAHAKAALEAYGREKVREGMLRAADIANSFYQVGQIGADIRAAILDEMEKLK